MSVEAAETELRANSGTQFKPEVVEALLAELARRPGPGERPAIDAGALP